MSATSFTAGDYDIMRHGCQTSARTVAPLIDLPPGRLVDVGCGEGWWALAFADLGWDVTGIDAPHDHVLGDRFCSVDLSHRCSWVGQYDLAISLEVAEHLSPRRAESFVDDLCDMAPVVLFSAAIPHQTGHGHINLRWSSWWANLFARNGYGVDPSIRWAIWDDPDVEPWYRQNLMLATRGGPTTGPLDVVHPIIHGWGR